MFFCRLSSFLFLLVYSLMQNSYYNDNRRHGVSLTLKNSLCASLFARAHEPPRDQRMYNIISFFFCYFLLPAYISPLSLFYSLQLPSPCSSFSTLSFLPLSLIVTSFIYFFLPLLLGVLRLLLVCSPFLVPFFLLFIVIPSAHSLSTSFSFIQWSPEPLYHPLVVSGFVAGCCWLIFCPFSFSVNLFHAGEYGLLLDLPYRSRHSDFFFCFIFFSGDFLLICRTKS